MPKFKTKVIPGALVELITNQGLANKSSCNHNRLVLESRIKYLEADSGAPECMTRYI